MTTAPTPTARVLPPAPGRTTTVNGRKYTCQAGSYLDVPTFDAIALESNGWIPGAKSAQSGGTALRPANPTLGMRYDDTDIGVEIVYDGATWRNPTTAAAV